MDKARRKADREMWIPLAKVARVLDMDEDRVKMYAMQGFLEERSREDGLHYEVASVYRMQSENLLREITTNLEDFSPQLTSKVESLAIVQYQRGMIESNAAVLRIVEDAARGESA